jgi:hypothetical protein
VRTGLSLPPARTLVTPYCKRTRPGRGTNTKVVGFPFYACLLPSCSVSRRPIWARARGDNLLVGPGTHRGRNTDNTCPSGVVKKYVGVDLAPNTRKNHLAVLSTGARTVRDMGSDGPRPHYRCGFSLYACWMVRTCGSDGPRVRRGSSSRRTWISPPSRHPVGDESSRVCLRVSRPPMMPLDDTGPK